VNGFAYLIIALFNIFSPKKFCMQTNDSSRNSRRNFLGAITTGTVALGLATVTPLAATAKTMSEKFEHNDEDPDKWFKKLKGKHKMVFDVTKPHEIFPFAWPRVFLMTNQATGTPENETNAVVVLRHSAIPYAMNDNLWAKYKFGERFEIKDSSTNAPSIRNPFWKPNKGDYKVPGIGEVQIGINELQQSGVMFCVCNAAITVYGNVVAESMNLKPEDVIAEWKAGLLPDIQIVPSGVWAVGRAQEHGCAYCFAS
jgi:intracellular sulfur oxidation DsrE/DsrF family protein